MNVSKNKVILAVAGSGKTTQLAKEALLKILNNEKRVLILTYTLNGIQCIKNAIKELNMGILDDRIDIMSWYSFLLNECVLPYQKDFDINLKIRGILFTNETPKDARGNPVYMYEKKSSLKRYITKSGKAYSDNLSDFLLQINAKDNGLYIKRLSDVYSDIFIDEVQDLNGEDLIILEDLLKSNIKIYLIGDHRQATFNTHFTQKFKQFNGSNIKSKFKIWETMSLLNIEEKTECHRSIQEICDFANMLYPNEPEAKSCYEKQTILDGVYLLLEKDIKSFIDKFDPFILRWNNKRDTLGFTATNYGESKALTKERILIFPTKPFLDFYLNNKKIENDVSKYYVAVTRARQSICIVVDKFVDRDYLEDFNIHGIQLKKFNMEKRKNIK